MRPNFSAIPVDLSLETHRRRLPHWEGMTRVYFVTFCLFDALPKHEFNTLMKIKRVWLTTNPTPWSQGQERDYRARFGAPIQLWMDQGFGSCLFSKKERRKILENALLHFDSKRYILDEFVIMPSHVHLLIMPLPGFSLSSILHSWKSYVGNLINKQDGEQGRRIWQHEGFDHIVRSIRNMEKFRIYIRENPTKAKLNTSKFSCARGFGIDCS